MSLTVIPAYREVSNFARQARDLPFEDAVDRMERSVRPFVRNLLSMLHPSVSDLGERSAITQLGDPDPNELISGLDELEAGEPKEVVERALTECSAQLARPNLNSRVLLLPGDGHSRVLARQMKGVLGFSLGAQAIMVFLWPVTRWKKWLAYSVSHDTACGSTISPRT